MVIIVDIVDIIKIGGNYYINRMMHFLLFLSQIFLLTNYLLLSRIFGPLGLVIRGKEILSEHMEHVTHIQHC